MHDLFKKINNCTLCGLYKTATNKVPGEGNQQADILFIGEAPGPTEDKKGKPFCGQAGKVLDKWLDYWRLSREDVFISNVCKCFPNEGGRIRKPTKQEMNLCSPYLVEMVRIMNPKLLIALGATPLEELTGISSGILKLGGSVLESGIKYGRRKVLVIPHPAYFLRNGSDGMDLIKTIDLKGIIAEKNEQKRLFE